jgi:hypothetical protein
MSQKTELFIVTAVKPQNLRGTTDSTDRRKLSSADVLEESNDILHVKLVTYSLFGLVARRNEEDQW